MVKENVYALIISVVNKVSPEAALRKMDVSTSSEELISSITREDWHSEVIGTGAAMLSDQLAGMSLRQLGRKYNISFNTARYRMNKAKKEGTVNG